MQDTVVEGLFFGCGCFGGVGRVAGRVGASNRPPPTHPTHAQTPTPLTTPTTPTPLTPPEDMGDWPDFDGASLAGLTALRTLSLSHYGGVDLRAMAPGVGEVHLEVRGGGVGEGL